MVVDLNDVVPFFDWLPGGLLTWLLVVACVAVGVTLFAWLVAAVRHGPLRGRADDRPGAWRTPWST